MLASASDPSGSPRDIEAELERRNAFLQLLQVVSVAANGAPTSTTDALQTTLDEVCRQTGWTVGHALLPGDDADGVLISSGIWHVDDPSDRSGLRRRHRGISFASGVGVPGRVLASGKPEHIADVKSLSEDDADRVRCSLIDEEHMRAVAGFPIMVGDEVCGMLEFFSETPFEADQMLLDVMARPWLAGGTAGEVFLATDTTFDANTSLSSGHEIFKGVLTTVGGLTTLQCQGAAGAVIPSDPTGATGPGINDFGNSSTTRGGTYSAAGKLFHDHNNTTDGYHRALIDPAFFTNKDASSGVGISILPNADAAFATSSTVTQFPQQFEVPGTNAVFAHWPSIGIDANDRVYLVWDTATTDSSGNLNNAIKLSTFDLHNTAAGFTTPITITAPGKSAFWPWVAVPSTTVGAGNVAVVWYQYDRATNPDSGSGNVSILESNVFGADGATPTILGPSDPLGAPVHNGGMCQSGTTCVATGQDRRLGDFFTNSVDQNGCVMIASGETTTDPSAATSRPLFIHQTNGTSLTGQSCAVASTALAEAPLASLLVIGGVGAVALLARRRRGTAAALSVQLPATLGELLGQQARHHVDGDGHHHHAEEVREQRVTDCGAPDRHRCEVSVRDLEGHADGERHVQEVAVGRHVVAGMKVDASALGVEQPRVAQRVHRVDRCPRQHHAGHRDRGDHRVSGPSAARRLEKREDDPDQTGHTGSHEDRVRRNP
jgi:hypothetical protein